MSQTQVLYVYIYELTYRRMLETTFTLLFFNLVSYFWNKKAKKVEIPLFMLLPLMNGLWETSYPVYLYVDMNIYSDSTIYMYEV